MCLTEDLLRTRSAPAAALQSGQAVHCAAGKRCSSPCHHGRPAPSMQREPPVASHRSQQAIDRCCSTSQPPSRAAAPAPQALARCAAPGAPPSGCKGAAVSQQRADTSASAAHGPKTSAAAATLPPPPLPLASRRHGGAARQPAGRRLRGRAVREPEARDARAQVRAALGAAWECHGCMPQGCALRVPSTRTVEHLQWNQPPLPRVACLAGT